MKPNKKKAVGLKNEYSNQISGGLEKSALAALIAGTGVGAAVGADKLINSEADHAKSKINGLTDFLNVNEEVGGAWNFLFGGESLAPIEKQSMARLLTGKGDDMDAAVLSDTDAMERVDTVLQKRPDLAPVLGLAVQAEVDVNIREIEHDITQAQLAESNGANGFIPLGAGVLAGGGMTGAAHYISRRGQ